MSDNIIMPRPRNAFGSAARLAAWLFACAAAVHGAEQSGVQRAFSLKATNAKCVELRGQWAKQGIAMTRGDDGTWSVTPDSIPEGIWEYSFTVDGLNVMDPHNPAIKPQREPKKNILHIPSVPPAPWDWQDVPHGTVHVHQYQSRALGRYRELLVYTPPGYETAPAQRYPLLVLQHGSGDNQRAWVEHGKANWILDSLFAAAKAVPTVVMMLNGHVDGAPVLGDKGQPLTSVEAFRSELFEDALPLAERDYRLAEGRENRAICGLSMGGNQSLSVGLGNLDRFAWVGAFSGAGHLEALKPALDAPKETNEKLRLLWIACGRDDGSIKRHEAFIAALEKGGIRHEWHLTDGDHSWPVWRGYLAEFAPLLFRRAP